MRARRLLLATSAGDRVVPGVSAGGSIRRRCDRSAEHRDTNSTRCLRPRCETMKGASVGRVLPADTWAVTRICREWRPPSTPLFQRAEEPLGGPVAEPVPQVGGEALEIGTGRPGRGGAGAAALRAAVGGSARRDKKGDVRYRWDGELDWKDAKGRKKCGRRSRSYCRRRTDPLRGAFGHVLCSRRQSESATTGAARSCPRRARTCGTCTGSRRRQILPGRHRAASRGACVFRSDRHARASRSPQRAESRADRSATPRGA